jgi:hypothetical protein
MDATFRVACCKHAKKRAPDGSPAVQQKSRCCESRQAGSIGLSSPIPTMPFLAEAPRWAGFVQLSHWSVPPVAAICETRWPIRAGPSCASELAIELQVLLS